MAFITLSKKYFKFPLLAAAVLLGLAASYFRVFDIYELQTYDWRCQFRGPRPVSKDVVLIDIANDTLEQLGAWPFDRKYHAALIEILGKYGAKALIFDILFSEPRENDADVVGAIKEAQNVYFPIGFKEPELHKGFFSAKMDSDLLPEYRAVAKGVGFVNIRADLDGKRRRVIPVISCQGKDYYQLSLRTATDLVGGEADKIVFKPGKYIELSPDCRLPLEEDSSFIINYAGQWKTTFQHYSYLKILYSYRQILEGEKPEIDLQSLKGKIFIVGLTSMGSHDISPVPVQSVYPMVGTYANVLNSILEKDFIRRVSRWGNLFILVLCAFLIGWISMNHRPVQALVYTLIAAGVFAACVIFAFCSGGWWLDLFYPLLVFFLLYSSATLSRVLSEIRKRELIENELKIASQIQKSFLPASMPEVKGFTLAVYFKPAKAVGGDLYSFIALSPEGKTGVMVGDVSGKGTPAALFMAKTVSEFKFSARDCLDPSRALECVNNAISLETGGLFVTMAYAIFDNKERKMLLSNGGHLPVVAISASGKSALLSAGEGMPIGVMEGTAFSNLEYSLQTGDIFAFYSDGVSEARNRKKEEYGMERLERVLSLHRLASVDEILEKTIADLNAFMGRAEQHDDITLILVKMGAVE